MQTLNVFLQEWEKGYVETNKATPLFDSARISAFTPSQKQLFALAFYHARGHFYKFLWFMGSLAPSEEFKKIILDNITEEFGGNKCSHEQLYMEFAKAVGVDVVEEVLTGRTNLPFIEEFNRGHINWLLTHDWDHKWSAFSAYERLDNVDYENLYHLAANLGLSGRPLLFFEVHRVVEHYDQASSLLEQIWQRNPEAVRAGFDFIGMHQAKLWRELSDAVFTLHE